MLISLKLLARRFIKFKDFSPEYGNFRKYFKERFVTRNHEFDGTFTTNGVSISIVMHRKKLIIPQSKPEKLVGNDPGRKLKCAYRIGQASSHRIIFAQIVQKDSERLEDTFHHGQSAFYRQLTNGRIWSHPECKMFEDDAAVQWHFRDWRISKHQIVSYMLQWAECREISPPICGLPRLSNWTIYGGREFRWRSITKTHQ